MEYNRMVAYIYSYSDGVKSKNTGFAKMEVRQDVLKLHINMRGAYSDSIAPWKVNLFYRENGRIRGIELGEINIRNGVGDYRYVGSASDIVHSGKAFGAIKGLYIMCDGGIHKMFASEWDDLGFAPSNIDNGRDNSDSAGPVIEFALQDVPSPESQPQPDFAATLASTIENARQPEQVRQEEFTERTEPDSQPDIAGQSEAVSSQLAAAEVADEVLEEWSVSQPDNGGGAEIYDRIIDSRDKVFLFADDDLYDVVEISVEDIAQFPEATRGLASNSFVNHGYYNFRHLILGRMRTAGGCGYFIGVPGVYTRRDRSTAAMFGFDYFKFSMRSDVRLGQFGYWYRPLPC